MFREFCKCVRFVPKSQEAFDHWESFSEDEDDENCHDERTDYKFPEGYDPHRRGSTSCKEKIEDDEDLIFNLTKK